MKIKKEFIGCKVWSPLMGRLFLVEENNGELLLSLGVMDIFELEEPNLVKKINVKNTKKRSNAINSDGDGIDNNTESELSI
jgi:hypothetical protein